MSGHAGEIKNPGSLQVSSGFRGLLVVLAIIGIASFLAALGMDKQRAWTSFVINHFYFLLLGVGGLFFAALQWLTGAMWSAPIRRLGEAFSAYLPVAFLSCIVLFFGIHELYHWSHPEAVQGDRILQGKSGYLNITFFIIRNVLALGLWMFFGMKMVKNSLAQDQNGDLTFTRKNRFMAPGFMILFAITLTVVSFDQIMSLEPHWFSTIFGVYTFAGLFYSTLASLCLLTIFLRRKGYLEGIVNDNHLHDLGKFMFAFAVFWAYIGFSQFMLIWYANLPEETTYFIKRDQGGWSAMMGILFLIKFVFPFFVLMPRNNKRSEKILILTAVVMLVAQWLDMVWMVQPEFFKGGPKIGWVEIGMWLGFLGLFGLAVTRFLSKNNVLAIKDPHLQESVFHHHQ